MSCIVVTSIVCFALVILVDGSHFLGGTITWKPLDASDNGSFVAIVITQTYLWTYSLVTCTSSMIASNQLVSAPRYSLLGTVTLDCIANCGSGSVGYTSVLIIPYCTDGSAVTGVTVGQRSDTVYLEINDDFSVAFQSAAWRPLATSGYAYWSISTNINVELRSDNDLFNNAPVATIMSPVNIYANQAKVINIPIADADGDPMVCRWSTSSNGVNECADVCPPGSLPPSTVIYPNCTIIITGQNIGDWFAVAVMVEDFINASSSTPLSSVPVQFLVHVVAPPACTNLPEIIGDPIEDSCAVVLVGQTFSSELIAINNCGSNVTITEISTLSFAGMDKSNLSMINSSTYYQTLTWTPTAAQVGYQVMCAMAYDSQDVQSAQYCFKFYVSTENLCSCPGDACSTTTTTSTIYTTTTSTVNNTEWILLGSLLGSALLLASILACCLCWYFCCSCGIRTFQLANCRGPFEYYYIEYTEGERFERYPLFNTRRPSLIFQSTSRKKDDAYYILDESPDSSMTRSPTNDYPMTNEWPCQKPLAYLSRNKYFRKPNRVTVYSLPPGTSSSSTILSEMNISAIVHHTPYSYERESGVKVRYVYCI